MLHVLGHVESGEFGLLAGMVFERLPIEREPFILFAISVLHFFVEAALGLVAQPLALHHVLEEARQLKITALIVNIAGHV